MERPWLILVSGPPCAGKSELAARLAGLTGWPVVAKDPFKEMVFDALGTGNAVWSRRLSRAAFDIQFSLAGELLGAGVPVLLEGNFTAPEHAGRVSAMAAAGAHLVQVACRADVAALAARQAARASGGLRHPGHLDGQPRTLAEQAARYAPLPFSPTFQYDTTSGGEAPWQALLAGLEAFGLPLGARR